MRISINSLPELKNAEKTDFSIHLNHSVLVALANRNETLIDELQKMAQDTLMKVSHDEGRYYIEKKD